MPSLMVSAYFAGVKMREDAGSAVTIVAAGSIRTPRHRVEAG